MAGLLVLERDAHVARGMRMRSKSDLRSPVYQLGISGNTAWGTYSLLIADIEQGVLLLLLAQLSRHRGGGPRGARALPCPPLTPVLFRVPALFGVFRRNERRSLYCSPLHLFCCLRAAHALAAARPAPAALRPSPLRRALRLRQLLLLHRALGQSARLPLLSTSILDNSECE